MRVSSHRSPWARYFRWLGVFDHVSMMSASAHPCLAQRMKVLAVLGESAGRVRYETTLDHAGRIRNCSRTAIGTGRCSVHADDAHKRWLSVSSSPRNTAKPGSDALIALPADKVGHTVAGAASAGHWAIGATPSIERRSSTSRARLRAAHQYHAHRFSSWSMQGVLPRRLMPSRRKGSDDHFGADASRPCTKRQPKTRGGHMGVRCPQVTRG